MVGTSVASIGVMKATTKYTSTHELEPSMLPYVGIQEIVRPLVPEVGSHDVTADERHIQEKMISVHGQDVKVVVSVKDQMYRFQIFAKRIYKYTLLIDRSGLDERGLVNEWLGVEKSLALYGQ